MSKNSKTLIIALSILIILGGAYYWSTIRANKASELTSEEYPPAIVLGNLDYVELVKIEIPGITLEKNNEIWELSSTNIITEGENPLGAFDLDQGQLMILTYFLTSVWAERIIDESPIDISVYGLDNTSNWAIITDSVGDKVTYYIGDTTPSGNSNYFMVEGDSKVYTISSYAAASLQFSLNSIRQKMIFPQFELWGLTQFRMEAEETSISIIVKPEQVKPYLSSSFITHILTSPYSIPRGISGESLSKILTPLSNLTVDDFVEDNPSSLSPYGLDRPARLFLEVGGNSLHLLIGNLINGRRYAKLPNDPNVFTLSGLEDLINVRPISLIDGFALIINIDTVDHLSITGGDQNLNIDIFDKEEDPAFFINGKKTEEGSFRKFYEAVIGLRIDSEYPRTGTLQSADRYSDQSIDREITIEYRLNTPPGERVSITLLPFNRDFYALRQEEAVEFLISRNQVRRIFEAVEAVVFE